MNEDELIDYLAKYNGFSKDYKNLFPNKEETISLLMKITLPNDLDDDFFSLEGPFISKMNSRIEYLDGGELHFNDRVVFIKHDPVSVKGDLLINTELKDFYSPMEVMKKNINDEITFHGGLEIRKDLLKEISSQNHDIEPFEIHQTKGYFLPYKEITHIYLKTPLESEDDIKRFSSSILKILTEAKEKKYKTIVFPLVERDLREVEHLIRLTKSYLRTSYSKGRVIFVTQNDSLYEKYLPLFN